MALTYGAKEWGTLGNFNVCIQTITGDDATSTYNSPHAKTTVACEIYNLTDGDHDIVGVQKIVNSTTANATVTANGNFASGAEYRVITIGR